MLNTHELLTTLQRELDGLCTVSALPGESNTLHFNMTFPDYSKQCEQALRIIDRVLARSASCVSPLTNLRTGVWVVTVDESRANGAGQEPLGEPFG